MSNLKYSFLTQDLQRKKVVIDWQDNIRMHVRAKS